MEPFTLTTGSFVLEQLIESDAPAVAEYCSEPVFERFMSTPWPYTLADAESFVGEYAPAAWRANSEWTWAIREQAGGELLGVIGLRLPSGMLGFWLGAPHRGRGIMSASVNAVVAAAFEHTELDEVLWEARIGNVASLRTVERAGFSFTGVAPGMTLSRNGDTVESWTAKFARGDDSSATQPGWPV